ncbi:MAG: hypothetical protein ABSA65_06145 [Acidimicrobiales bacterium]
MHCPAVRRKQLPDRLAALDLVAAKLASDLRRAAPAGGFRETTAAAEGFAGGARACPRRRWPLVAGCVRATTSSET